MAEKLALIARRKALLFSSSPPHPLTPSPQYLFLDFGQKNWICVTVTQIQFQLN